MKNAGKYMGIKKLIVFAAVMLLAACNLSPEPKPKYKITYYDYESETVKTVMLENGKPYELPVPQREGYYTFMGYSLYENGSFMLTHPDGKSIGNGNFYGNTTIYQIFDDPKPVTISFDTGVEAAIPPVTAYLEFDLPVLPLPPEMDNYVFDGWYSALEDGIRRTNGDGSAVSGKEKFTRTAYDLRWADSVTFYARYEYVGDYTIAFVTGVDGQSIPRITVSLGDTLPKMPIPEVDGYIFDGWFSGTFSSSYDYPRYTDGDGNPVEGKEVFTKENYDLTSYSLKPDPYGIVTNTVKGFSAHYLRSTFTILFDTAGQGEFTSINVSYGEPIPKMPVPEKEGHDFGGWWSIPRYSYETEYAYTDGDGNPLNNYMVITNIRYGLFNLRADPQGFITDNTITFKAKYNIQHFNVTLKSQGDTDKTLSITWKEKLPASVRGQYSPKKLNGDYKVVLYYSESEEGEKFDDVITEDKTLYAVWGPPNTLTLITLTPSTNRISAEYDAVVLREIDMSLPGSGLSGVLVSDRSVPLIVFFDNCKIGGVRSDSAGAEIIMEFTGTNVLGSITAAGKLTIYASGDLTLKGGDGITGGDGSSRDINAGAVMPATVNGTKGNSGGSGSNGGNGEDGIKAGSLTLLNLEGQPLNSLTVKGGNGGNGGDGGNGQGTASVGLIGKNVAGDAGWGGNGGNGGNGINVTGALIINITFGSFEVSGGNGGKGGNGGRGGNGLLLNGGGDGGRGGNGGNGGMGISASTVTVLNAAGSLSVQGGGYGSGGYGGTGGSGTPAGSSAGAGGPGIGGSRGL